MTSPGDVVLLVAHILSAVVGFGALGATAAFAAAVRRSADPFSAAALRSYFRPGHNLAARALYLVPVFGLALVAAGWSHVEHHSYPLIGLALWAVALGLAHGLIWPAEAEIQTALEEGDSASRPALDAACARVAWAGAATSLLFVAAFVVMVAQP